MNDRDYSEVSRFSVVRVILSDVLPTAAFHPDFEKRVLEEMKREDMERKAKEQGR